eukprot:GSChrysophyteH2.ASY1.ANO1.912.1 assembled CDS
MTPDFRRAIFRWKYNEAKDGAAEHCIPLQLQKLFGFLALSSSRAVDTVALTKSFGWEGSEVFQQQDVQECMRVLFDALEESFRGTDSADILDSLYAGTMVDYLRCIDVEYETEREDKFQDLSLAIVPFGADSAPCATLAECVELYLRPEILDGSNQYRVEETNTRSDAIKGLKFCSLPRILSIHLKRFVFDFSGAHITQKKLNDVVKFPVVLDMNRYVGRRKADKQQHGEKQGAEAEAEAGAGDEFEGFLRGEIGRLRGGKGSGSEATEDENPIQQEEEEERHAEMLSYKTEDIPGLLESRGPWVYELYAVLIHSGSLHGGHYYAYIKDLGSGKWWNFNDSSVKEMAEEEVLSAWGTAFASTARPTTSANAYMLMYQQARGASAEEEESSSPRAVDVPDYIRQMVAQGEAEAKKARAEELERRNRIQLRVHYDGGSASVIPGYLREKKVFAKKTDLYLQLLRSLWRELDMAQDTRFAALLPADTADAPEDAVLVTIVRVRDYNGYTKVPGATHDAEVKGDVALENMTFHDFKEVLVETKRPDEKWSVWHAAGISVNLHVHDGEKNLTVLHNVRLPREATISDLRAITKEKSGYSRVRLMRISERYKNRNYDAPVFEGEVFTAGSKRLKEDLRIYDNANIHAEEDPTGDGTELLTESSSAVIARYVHCKNSITLKINRPPSTSFEEILLASTLWTVADLRKGIAAKLQLEETSFKMHKSNIYGVELRLGDESTLAKSYIYNNTTVAVVLGRPAMLGQYALQAVVFRPVGPQRESAGDVHYLPEPTAAELSAPETPSGASEDAPAVAENNIENRIPAKTASFVLFADVDLDESDDVGDVGDDAVPALVDVNAIESESVHVTDVLPVAQSTDALSLEEMQVSELSENNSPLDLPTAPRPPPRRLSGAIKASLEGKLELRPPGEKPPLTPSVESAHNGSNDGGSFVDQHTCFSSTAADFDIVPLDLSVSKDTEVADLRKLAFKRLQEYDASQLEADSSYKPVLGDHQVDASYLRLRVSLSAWKPPGDLLRDGLRVEQAIKTPLIQDKQIVLQLLDVPETLPKQHAGDVLILVQRWHRGNWTLGQRKEVYLRGGLSIKDSAAHLAALFGIPLPSLSVYHVDKLSSDVLLHCLPQEKPSNSFYSSKRKWFRPQDEPGQLRYAYSLRLSEGDLLIVQDTAEPLRELSVEERASIGAINNSASLSICGTAVTDNSTSSSGSASSSCSTSTTNWSRGGGGIRIKTHKDRLREGHDSNSGSATPTTPTTPPRTASVDGLTAVTIGPAPFDDVEFSQQGGTASIEDMFVD